MKTKSRNICRTCRRRKLGCDGKRPGCSQCTFSGLECGGYPVDWRFVAQGQEPNPEVSPGAQHDRPPCQIQAKAQSSRYSQEPKTSDNTLLSQTCLYRPDAITLADVIVKEFVPKSERSILPYDSDHVEPRICGSWVEVLSDLPSLRIGNSVLSRAITALGVSILSRPNNVNIECTRTYETAIHMLRQSLSVDESALKFDLLPAVMCLTMVEMMIPDSATAIAAHTKAVGLLFQKYSPELYKTGLFHRLFVGFRPLMVIQALQYREPTFLALPCWVDLPFSTIDPSLMQRLLNEIITLPSLLHERDLVFENTQQNKPCDIDNTLHLFFELYARLLSWADTVGIRNDHFNWKAHDYEYAPPTENNSSRDTQVPHLYPNVTMANIFTHLWTFQIICLVEIERLTLFASCPVFDSQTPVRTHAPSKSLGESQERCITLARRITLSMDYLLQDELEMFGPASTFFPLRIAYQTFKGNQPQLVEDIASIESIVDRLTRKGFLASRSIVLST